jgi:hypothetical protein
VRHFGVMPAGLSARTVPPRRRRVEASHLEPPTTERCTKQGNARLGDYGCLLARVVAWLVSRLAQAGLT